MSARDHDLSRFLQAQAPIYDRALAEIRAGRKESHWMWFIFPQFAGLGHSDISRRYAIASLDEARAFLAHEILGKRLLECCEAVVALEGCSAHSIFGSPDDLKLRSSASLFATVSDPDSVFVRLIDKYFGGVQDPLTMRLIGSPEAEL